MKRLKFVVAWILIIITSFVMVGNVIVAILLQHMVVDFWIMLLVITLFLNGAKQIPKLKTFMMTHAWLVLFTITLVLVIPDMITTPDFSYNPTRIIWK